ncbi:MAG TPA: glucoamylase family protein, partial [Saprospiraceae bacterium]|nr:glucoamylase family protein [Saprospiraceae bacterium]
NQIFISANSDFDTNSINNGIQIIENGNNLLFTFSFSNSNTLKIQLNAKLKPNTNYTIILASSIKNKEGAILNQKSINFSTVLIDFQINSLKINGIEVVNLIIIPDVYPKSNIAVLFNKALKISTINSGTIKLFSSDENIALNFSISDSNRLVNIVPNQPMKHLTKYFLTFSSSIESNSGEPYPGQSKILSTAIDTTNKFPIISDDALLTLVQSQTFKYFYDYAHPVSGLARERFGSGDIVTSGGSGFGCMAIIVGIERSFITRTEGVQRLGKIVNFLKNADRYHGAFPHWMNGSTGKTIPFTANDNGADLVETSYLMQGLLTVRAYLNSNDPTENQLIGNINELWEAVEWDWFTKGNQNVLYWHWSPDKNWAMNVQIKGWNECLITYFLAAASPTHPIQASVYHMGWASNGNFKNGNTYYNYVLPLGQSYGGPLFFSHYSFLGLNPKNLSDTYADYWTQNVNHSKINQAYCITNPKSFPLYSEKCWGLTASDDKDGYDAHSPTNDQGVISPTAALSSMPYTPDASLKALHFFYYTLGDKLWKDYGFIDAFDTKENWYASSFLAIDQGPIILMIENYRTGLLWNLFMSNPEVTIAKNKLGFN